MSANTPRTGVANRREGLEEITDVADSELKRSASVALRSKVPVKNRRGAAWIAWVMLGMAASSLSACADDESSQPKTKTRTAAAMPGPIDYAPDHLLDVAVTLPEPSWNVLRQQGRDLTTHGCNVPKSYDWFEASLAIDGANAEAGKVRKKGSTGSLSVVRPSIKLKFEREGMPDTTLNNNRQDPSNVHQCMTYGLFARAGLPAPRCALAHVSVNGRDLGIYTHVEPIDEPFLERSFGDGSGNLYEGEHADFTAEKQALFQVKTNEDANDTSDLGRLTAALASDDAQLEANLGKVLDLDEFLTYWAMEILAGHGSGYSGNDNNFYVYHSPKDDRFHFIVYGADESFEPGKSSRGEGLSIAVQVAGAVAARLYAHEGLRLRYFERLRQLMDQLWIEADLIAEVNHWASVAQSPPSAVETVIEFIQGQRANLLKELDGGIGRLVVSNPVCVSSSVLPSSGSIEVTWLAPDGVPSALATISYLDIPFEGGKLAFAGGAAKGWGQFDAEDPNLVKIRVIGQQQGANRIVGIGFELPKGEFFDGTHVFHSVESVGAIAELSPELEQGPLLVAISGGTYTLEGTASAVAGGAVKLSWSAKAIPWVSVSSVQ